MAQLYSRLKARVETVLVVGDLNMRFGNVQGAHLPTVNICVLVVMSRSSSSELAAATQCSARARARASFSSVPMALEGYLKGLDRDKAERTRMVATLMQYPRSKSLLDRADAPALTAYYTCEAAQCSLAEVEAAIRENVDLKAFGATGVALTLVKEVTENPDDFVPHKLDGYQLSRAGFDLLRLQRKEGDAAAASSGRMGVLEYNDVHAAALDDARRASMAALEAATERIVAAISDAKGAGSCTIM